MFLNENTTIMASEFSLDDVKVEGTVPATFESAVIANYELSEDYHSLVESMIIAEHTAIVNEDMNLLMEAENSFFKKIANLWHTLVEYIKKAWNDFVAWFKSKMGSGKKFVETYGKEILKKAADKQVKVQGYPYQKDPFEISNKDYLEPACKSLASYIVIASDPNKTQVDNDVIKEGAKDARVTEIFGKSFKDKNKFKEELYTKLRGAKEKKEVVLGQSDASTILNYIKSYDLSKSQKAYNDAIKVYKKLADVFNKISKEIAKGSKEVSTLASQTTGVSKEDSIYAKDAKGMRDATRTSMSNKYSKISGICKSISSGLNLVLGITSSCAKERYSMYMYYCRAILNGKAEAVEKKEAKKEATNVSESASILDMFAL